MRNDGLIKTFIADEAIAANLIVKIGSAAGYAGVADAATDKVLGVADSIGADAAGDNVDVVLSGIAWVKAGDTITLGDWLTAESGGRAVPAAPAATATANVIGRALAGAADGDLIPVLLGLATVTNGANS